MLKDPRSARGFRSTGQLEKGIGADRSTTERLLLAVGAKSTVAEEWTLGPLWGGRADGPCTTALPPKAEVDLRSCDVADVPTMAVSGCNNGCTRRPAMDNLVGAGELGSCTGDRQLIPDSCRNRCSEEVGSSAPKRT
jgi:hypothetical protein